MLTKEFEIALFVVQEVRAKAESPLEIAADPKVRVIPDVGPNVDCEHLHILQKKVVEEVYFRPEVRNGEPQRGEVPLCISERLESESKIQLVVRRELFLESLNPAGWYLPMAKEVIDRGESRRRIRRSTREIDVLIQCLSAGGPKRNGRLGGVFPERGDA